MAKNYNFTFEANDFTDYSTSSIKVRNKVNEIIFLPKSKCGVIFYKEDYTVIVPEWLYKNPKVKHFFRFYDE